MSHQRRILAFVLSLQPNLDDAEDIVQYVSRTLWEKFDRFEPGTNFAAWAFEIARLKVLEFRRQQARSTTLLSEGLIDQLADEAAERGRYAEARQRALDGCLEALDDRQRKLVAARHAQQFRLQDLARELGRSTVTVRKMLRNVYGVLAACVERKLAEEGR